MKHIVSINENFKLVDLSNSRWFGHKPDENYPKLVRDYCLIIAMEDIGISQKHFEAIDRLIGVINKVLKERHQEFDAIVHNCNNRHMRKQYCAETVYNALLQGRLRDLSERSWTMGGFKGN